MDTVEFNVYEEFTQDLLTRFKAFINSLTGPCIVLIDIESIGGDTDVFIEMEQAIAAKKAEGYFIITNVEDYAYSCGMFLFLLGDIKLCTDWARFLYHSSGFSIKDERLIVTDLKEMIQVLELHEEVTDRVVSENTTVEPGMLEVLKKNDNFLSKEDLIFLGFMEREYEPI